MILLSSLTKKFYRPNEVAKLLECSVRTIQLYCNKGFFGEIIYQNENYRLIQKEGLVAFLDKKNMLFDDVATKKHDIIYVFENDEINHQFEKIAAFVILKKPLNVLVFNEENDDKYKELLKAIELIEKNLVNRIFLFSKDVVPDMELRFLESSCAHQGTQVVFVNDD